MSDALAPCPFCGTVPTVCPDDSYGSCMISCHCEHEPMVQRVIGDMVGCIAAWNRRSAPAEAAREFERGAEAMREVAATWHEIRSEQSTPGSGLILLHQHYADQVRALPLPSPPALAPRQEDGDG